MADALRHRGPDGEGAWSSRDGRVRLAHRRLSVIDLATGQQPMINQEGTVALVFNGEIYNYRELRASLERDGTRFTTQSDTEVLLRLYERQGVACLDSLRGMFAFALWDDQRERLVLARDRIGKKPLYYAESNGVLYFASALRAVHEASGRRPIDVSAIDSYLTLGYVPAPRTAFEGIRKLPAATVAVYEGGVQSTRRYWDVARDDAPFDGSEDDALDRIDEIIGTAVDIRLRSDVPLGVFLSGGIDSSLVTAVAVRKSALPVRTFSIAFDDPGFDESAYAAAVARHLGTQHECFHVRPDVMTLLPEYVRHYGEPFADSSAFPTWVLAEHTRRHVTVALGGDGGDECFAGYDWYRTAARLSRIGRLVPSAAASVGSRALARIAAGGGTSTRRARQLGRGLAVISHGEAAERFAALRTFVSEREAEGLYAGPLAEHRRAAGPSDAARLAALYRECDGTDLRRMRYVDIRTYLADCLMPKVDVATMAHGLEARAPLLDQELVRFALSLPDEWLVDRSGGKPILKKLLARYVPAHLFDRPKQGFTPPLAPWFAGAFRTSLDSMSRSEALRETGWFLPNGIADLIDEHARGHRDHSQRLFELLVLEAWLRSQ
jgi:asparagine synthase (glutamine-hydrolysing)